MPSKPEWLLRVPEILEELMALEAPVVDRSVIERVFRLRRRRAIELLHWFGGYQAGRTFLLDRSGLIEQLRVIARGDDFHYERRRKERLTEVLERARTYRLARNVRVPIELEAVDRKLADLPEGLRLRPGQLTVDFNGVEDLLRKLYELGRAAANDFERFQAAAEGGV